MRDIDELKKLKQRYVDLMNMHGEHVAEYKAFRRALLELNRFTDRTAPEETRLRWLHGRSEAQIREAVGALGATIERPDYFAIRQALNPVLAKVKDAGGTVK